MMNEKPVIVLGSGGHAKVVINTLKILKRDIIGCVSYSKEDNVLGVNVIGDDDILFQYTPDQIEIVNGIGSIGSNELRKDIFLKFKRFGYQFVTLVHPSAILPLDYSFSEGVQIMAGVVIQPDVTIGVNSIINTRVCIDHDCVIGGHSHISPGTVLCGSVLIEDDVHIGAGSTIVQNIRVGQKSIVGAGSLVLNSVPSNTLVYGVPAKGGY